MKLERSVCNSSNLVPSLFSSLFSSFSLFPLGLSFSAFFVGKTATHFCSISPCCGKESCDWPLRTLFSRRKAIPEDRLRNCNCYMHGKYIAFHKISDIIKHQILMSWLNQIDYAICKSWPIFNLDPMLSPLCLSCRSHREGKERERSGLAYLRVLLGNHSNIYNFFEESRPFNLCAHNNKTDFKLWDSSITVHTDDRDSWRSLIGWKDARKLKTANHSLCKTSSTASNFSV